MRPRIVAARLGHGRSLEQLEPVHLAGWDGRPARQRTEARVAWCGPELVIEFRCAFDGLIVDPGLPRDRSVPGLWRLDVVEVFVSDRAEGVPYRELEVTPLGQWLSLSFERPRVESAASWAVTPRVETAVGEAEFRVKLEVSLAELRTGAGAEGDGWRLGLFRIAGHAPDREHYSLAPTLTPRPDFHQPLTWASLTLAE